MASRTKVAPVPAWFRFAASMNSPFVFGPAETIAAWPGSAPTGRFTLHFTYWQPFLSLLPPELAPQGDPDGPTLLAANADEAADLVKRLGAVLRGHKPGLQTKVDRKLNLTRFVLPNARWCALTSVPETHGQVAIAAAGNEPRVHDVAGPVLMTTVLMSRNCLWARAIGNDLVFVDTAAAVDGLDALVTGEGEDRGVWRFNTLAAALSAFLSVTNLKGIDDATDAVAAFAAALGRKPGVEFKPRNRDFAGGAAVLPITPGSYRALTGGGPKARWIRFTPA